uniref:Thyroglobulin type-1 domain-containing protein n=2 Tax=Tetranychus urticae TaxID=32264 RepID=T1KCB5_TETUR
MCPLNYCSLNKCPKEIKVCEEGYVLLENSTTCGCCHSCVKIGDLGETCVKTALQNIPAIICGDQLVCTEAQPLPQCAYGNTKCLQHRTEALKTSLNESEPNYIPGCNTFGDYSNYQCFGKRCFCVDENGDRIFGDFLDSQKSVNCACSRDLHKMISIQPQIPFGSPQCQSDGNYRTLQTTNTHGYCLDTSIKEGRGIKGAPVTLDDINKLPCYGHQDFPCWSELTRRNEELKFLKKKFDFVVGYELPECNLDGSYKAKQCDETSCYCVNQKGERYGARVTIPRDSSEIEQMRCNCIRDKDLLRQANDKTNWSDYDCDHLGNYNPIQCFGDSCFCVDQNGLPIDYERYNVTLKDTINCTETV